uniref:F-box domain-containing protein n=1 Tax=Ditylenchus dipsaci TaxID=166011 RepID=A0A915DFK3_9BILA
MVRIFEYLEPSDRVRIEQVCSQWRYLAKKRSWSKYTRFYFEHFGHVTSKHQFKQIFERVGQHVVELDGWSFWLSCPNLVKPEEIKTTVFELFPLLTKLQHLNMINCRWETPDLDLISDCLPQLKSIVVESVMGSAFTNFTSLLTKCNQLEVLQIRDGFSPVDEYIWTTIPPKLKCLEIAPSVLCESLSNQLSKIELVSLILIGNYGDHVILEQLQRVDLTWIRHAGLVLSQQTFENLMPEIFSRFPQLQALDLEFTCRNPEYVISAILDHCLKLEHLKLQHCGRHPANVIEIKSDNLVHIAQLQNLKSFWVNIGSKENTKKLFELLVENGNLEYFRTFEELPMDLVRESVTKCKFYDEIEAVKEGEDQKHMLYLSRPSDKLSANQSRWVKYLCQDSQHGDRETLLFCCDLLFFGPISKIKY